MRTITFTLLSCLAAAVYADPPPAPNWFHWVANPDYTDEFNGNQLDSNKWHYHHPRWRGRPPAKFMPENVSVGGGLLHLTNGMLPEPQGNFTMGGAAVVSKKTTAFYGYYECRLKASNISMSSTFWMSNPGHDYPGIGRVSQELDILETVGGSKRDERFARYMNSNTHVWHNGTSKGRTAGNKVPLPTKSDEDFYIYGCWWENASRCHFYLNGKHVGTVDFDTSLVEEPFRHPMHINMVTETYDWETPPTPEEVNDPTRNTTLIDWVRAYTLEPSDGSLPEWKLKSVYNDYRKWTSANGKSTTRAKLIKARFNYVELEKKDGKTVKVPLKKLCKEDQELVAAVLKSP